MPFNNFTSPDDHHSQRTFDLNSPEIQVINDLLKQYIFYSDVLLLESDNAVREGLLRYVKSQLCAHNLTSISAETFYSDIIRKLDIEKLRKINRMGNVDRNGFFHDIFSGFKDGWEKAFTDVEHTPSKLQMVFEAVVNHAGSDDVMRLKNYKDKKQQLFDFGMGLLKGNGMNTSKNQEYLNQLVSSRELQSLLIAKRRAEFRQQMQEAHAAFKKRLDAILQNEQAQNAAPEQKRKEAYQFAAAATGSSATPPPHNPPYNSFAGSFTSTEDTSEEQVASASATPPTPPPTPPNTGFMGKFKELWGKTKQAILRKGSTPPPPTNRETPLYDTEVQQRPKTPVDVPMLNEKEQSMGGELDIVLVRTHGIESIVQHYADDALERPDGHYKGPRGLFRRVRDSFMRPIDRHTAVRDTRNTILSTENYLAGTGREAEFAGEMQAIRSRFLRNEEGFLHRAAGEQKQEILAQENSPLRDDLQQLLLGFVQSNPTWSRDAFEQQRHAILRNHSMVSEDNLVTDNLYDVALRLLQDPQAESKIRSMRLVLGDAQIGVRTETQYGTIDRVIHSLDSSFLGRYVPAHATAVGVAVAVGIGQGIARSKVASWGTFGLSSLFAGVIGGVRANESFQRDLFNDRRDAAMGEEFTQASYRRSDELEALRYEMRQATDLTSALRQPRHAPTTLTTPQDQDLAMSELSQLLSHIAEAEARIGLSDANNIDLIQYSSRGAVEKERFDLDIAVAEAKVEARMLHQALQTSAGGDIANVASAGTHGISNDLDASYELRRSGANGRIAAINDTVIATNRAANARRRRSVLMHSAVAAGSSFVFAAGTYGVTKYINGFFETADYLQPQNGTNHFLKGNVHLDAINGSTFQPSTGGGYEMVAANGEVISGLQLDTNGYLTQDSLDLLHDKGYTIASNMDQFLATPPSFTKSYSPAEYLGAFKDQMVHISQFDWAHNNTVPFDLNELRLDWGAQGTGVVPAGQPHAGAYTFAVPRMTAGGSLLGTEQFNVPQLLDEGKVHIALSITHGSQDYVFTVPVGADGQAYIDPQSDAGKMLFRTNASGHAVFTGNWAHAMYFEETPTAGAELRGVSLATHIGESDPSTIEKIIGGDRPNPRTTIIPPLEQVRPDGVGVGIPFPLFWRTEPGQPVEKKSTKDLLPQAPASDTPQDQKILPAQKANLGAIGDSKKPDGLIEDKRTTPAGLLSPAKKLLAAAKHDAAQQKQQRQLDALEKEFEHFNGDENNPVAQDLKKKIASLKVSLDTQEEYSQISVEEASAEVIHLPASNAKKASVDEEDIIHLPPGNIMGEDEGLVQNNDDQVLVSKTESLEKHELAQESHQEDVKQQKPREDEVKVTKTSTRKRKKPRRKKK